MYILRCDFLDTHLRLKLGSTSNLVIGNVDLLDSFPKLVFQSLPVQPIQTNQSSLPRYLLQYQEPIPCEQLVTALCDIKQAYTQFGGKKHRTSLISYNLLESSS